MAKVVDSYTISEGSGKETNHYVFSIKGSGIRYKSGDAMGLFPKNNKQLVKDTIVKLRAKKSDLVSTGDVDETTLENALMHRFVIQEQVENSFQWYTISWERVSLKRVRSYLK